MKTQTSRTLLAVLLQVIVAYAQLPVHDQTHSQYVAATTYPGVEFPPLNCKNFLECLVQSTESPPSYNRDWINIGIVVDPSKRAFLGDRYCPSGRCQILDPAYLCDGYGPHCIPLGNLRQPLLPCDPRNPYCASNGFQIDFDVSCHPLDDDCGEGGVIVNPRPCAKSRTCLLGFHIPPWIDIDDNLDFNVTDPAHNWVPSSSQATGGQGIRIRLNYCPKWVPECSEGDWIIVHPDDVCQIGEPDCIDEGRIISPFWPELPIDLCPSGSCRVLRIDLGCHPQDATCRGGISVDPIPCPIGSSGCSTGLRLPRPIIIPRPGRPQRGGGGIWILPPPSLAGQDVRPMPGSPSVLVPDFEGDIQCSYVEIHPFRPKLPKNWPSAPEPPRQPPMDIPEFKPVPSEKPITNTPNDKISSQPQQKQPQPSTQEPPPEVPTPSSPPPSSQPPPPPPPPTSKFPCSKSDTNPCLGNVIRGWSAGGLYWDYSGQFAKPNMPKRGKLYESSFSQDTILELVDSWFNNAHYTIYIDGEAAGESDEKELQNNRASCSGGPDCVSKGFSHAFVFIPKGNHNIEIAQTDGYVNGDPDRPYTYGFTQYLTRLLKPCDGNNCPA